MEPRWRPRCEVGQERNALRLREYRQQLAPVVAQLERSENSETNHDLASHGAVQEELGVQY